MPFFAPLPQRASNALFIVRVRLARDQVLFPGIFIVFFFLVIALVSIGLLLGVMLGPDFWVVDVNIILAFGSRKINAGLGFSTLSVKEKVLHEVLSPQCQGIIATYALVDSDKYRSVFHLLISHRLADLF